MKDRWEDMWEKLGAHGVPQDVFDELVQGYSSPDRFYHSLTHVEDCLALVDKTRSLAAHPEEVELAIWFHDAVYDTRRDDNEQKSAAWAEAVTRDAGLSNAIAERVSRSILATRHDTQVTDTDSQLLVDVDLSILGKTNGDRANNTNAGLACGVGPAISNGTNWKNIYSGATY